MAKRRGDTIIEKAIRWIPTQKYKLITYEAAALKFYGNRDLASRRKSHRIISKVRKHFRQDHPEWHLHIATVYRVGWYPTDNPHDALIDLIQPETMMWSYGERYIEELEAVDVNGLGEKLKEAVYKHKALGIILEELGDKIKKFKKDVAKLMPIEELERRRKIKGIRIPKMLAGKMQEN